MSDYERELLRAAVESGPDWFLQNFVAMANEDDNEIGVTLLIGGSLVSGTVISGSKYFTLFGETLGTAIGMEQDAARALFQPIINDFYSRRSGDDQAEDNPADPPSYIHLRDARVFQSGAKTPADHQGILWRGKLASVDGFIIGELGPTREARAS